ncbi:MFS transporter [Pseudogracilibacillus sp. SE30717A]|uniref:MFS transporter n=1 Tax=Pseudogracilibacillus sp. SE30717A TaxID=3098293 RepID=UPI00300E30A7
MEPKKEVNSSSYQTVWRNPGFMFLWSGNAIATFTFYIFTISLPLIIYDLTQSPLAMSSMRAIEFIPNIILAVFIGVLVDRYHRKKLLMLSVLVQILVLFALIVLLYTSSIQLWLIYSLGFILYSSSYMFGNAFHSTIPNLVPEKQLTEANSSITLATSTIEIIGPAFAGMLLLSFNYTNGLIFTMAGFFILLIFTGFVNITPHQGMERKEESKFVDEIKEGWISLRENKELWALTIVILLTNIAAAFTLAVLIFYSVDILKLTEAQIGIILGSSAVGGIIAASIAKKSLRFFKRGIIMILALVIDLIGYTMLVFSFTWILLIIGMFLIGFGGATMGIHYSTLRQSTTPNHLLGRVAGTSSMLMKLAVPFSFLIAGILAEIIDINYIFLISLVITIVLIFYLSRSTVVKID